MSRSSAIQLDAVLVRTARYLVVIYLVVVLADRADVATWGVDVRAQLLFWVTLLVGLAAVFVRYRPYARTALRHGVALGGRLRTRDNVRVLSATTRYLTVAFFAVVAAEYLGFPAYVYLDARVLYGLVLVVLSATLLVRDDPVATNAARWGAVVFVAGLVLGRFVPSVPSDVGVGSLAFATLLLGLTVWVGQDRLSTRSRPETWTEVNRYTFALLFLTGVAAALVFYRLGFQHLHGDEHQVVAAAAGFYHTGEFRLWNWITSEPTTTVYDRAWPHTALVAASYAVFGVSEWSSRLPSALAGVLTVPISYFVVRYFLEQRRVALVTSASLALYPALIDLFRWTRMYALLIPLFLLLTYLAYRVLTEGNTVDFRNRRVNAFVDRYADFNVGLGLLTLPVFLVATQVHRNALFLLPAVYLFSVYQYYDTRERKYLVAAVAGTVGLVALALVATFTDHLTFVSTFIAPFTRDNTVYLEYLLQYPFPTGLGAALFLVGLGAAHLLPDERTRAKWVYLYVLCGFSLVFLVFVGDRYASFVYVVHVVPVGIALVTGAYLLFVDALDRQWVSYGLLALLIVGLVVPLFAGTPVGGYQALYYEDPQDFTTAYDTIERNYDEGEAVFAQYPRRYYLRDLDDDAVVVDMRSHQRYGPDEFADDISRHESGWLVWSSRKSYHVHPTIRAYSEEHFLKLHGRGVDDTGVEVYYYNASMTREPVPEP